MQGKKYKNCVCPVGQNGAEFGYRFEYHAGGEASSITSSAFISTFHFSFRSQRIKPKNTLIANYAEKKQKN
jgi:hypothetical protein